MKISRIANQTHDNVIHSTLCRRILQFQNDTRILIICGCCCNDLLVASKCIYKSEASYMQTLRNKGEHIDGAIWAIKHLYN